MRGFSLCVLSAFAITAQAQDWELGARLRQDPSDLGPAPNIFIEGRGNGLQLDLEWRQVLRNAWEVGAGLRHWWLRARSGSREAVGTRVPLTELESERTGLTLGLARRW